MVIPPLLSAIEPFAATLAAWVPVGSLVKEPPDIFTLPADLIAPSLNIAPTGALVDNEKVARCLLEDLVSAETPVPSMVYVQVVTLLLMELALAMTLAL